MAIPVGFSIPVVFFANQLYKRGQRDGACSLLDLKRFGATVSLHHRPLSEVLSGSYLFCFMLGKDVHNVLAMQIYSVDSNM